MIKHFFRKLFIVTMSVAFFCFLFKPVLFKKDYIKKYSKIELPQSAKVIDYQVELSPLFGVDLPYIKLTLNEDAYNSIDLPVFSEVDESNEYMYHVLSKSIDLETVEEFKWIDQMGSKESLIAAQTRMTYCILTKESGGDHYFYFYTY